MELTTQPGSRPELPEHAQVQTGAAVPRVPAASPTTSAATASPARTENPTSSPRPADKVAATLSISGLVERLSATRERVERIMRDAEVSSAKAAEPEALAFREAPGSDAESRQARVEPLRDRHHSHDDIALEKQARSFLAQQQAEIAVVDTDSLQSGSGSEEAIDMEQQRLPGSEVHASSRENETFPLGASRRRRDSLMEEAQSSRSCDGNCVIPAAPGYGKLH